MLTVWLSFVKEGLLGVLPAVSWTTKLDRQFDWNNTLSFEKGLGKSK